MVDLTPSPVPDYCEPLIGYRVWAVTPDRHLQALSIGTRWEPYQRQEAGHVYPHWSSAPWIADPPADTACFRAGLCGACGIYALKSMDDVIALLGDLYYHYSYVVGSVALWGRVVVHEHGYRAQYAYPQTILGAHAFDGSAIAATYGIPFTEDPTWKSAILSRQSSSNRYGNPYQFVIPPLIQFRNQWGNQPWKSQYLLRPDAHKLLIEPPPPEEPKLHKYFTLPELVTPKYYRTPAGLWAPGGLEEPGDEDDQPVFCYMSWPSSTRVLRLGFLSSTTE